MKQKFSKLALKMIIGLLLMGVIICICSSQLGYVNYKANIQKQYNGMAYDIAETAKSYLDEEDMKEYVALINGDTLTAEQKTAVMETDAYQKVKKQLTHLRDAMDANDVFVFCVDLEELTSYAGTREDWMPLVYMFDSYHQPELSYPFGEKGSFNPEFIQELTFIAKEGKIVEDNYFISKGQFGYNTSAILPVTVDGHIYMVAVEIPMSTLQEALDEYVVNNILIIVAIVLVMTGVFLFYLLNWVIKPIKSMSDAALDFVSSVNMGSEEQESTITKLSIKTKDELGQLCNSLKEMEVDIHKYVTELNTVTAEKERIGAELDIATKIQASMLPCIFPAFPEREEFEVFASMTPAKEVGGDFYDFFMVDEDNLAIVMADVSGKGVPAALFMVIGKTLIKDHTTPGKDLGEVFTEVNQLLCEANSEQLFITAFVGVLNLKTGELRYVNAGHEHPFIAKKGQPFVPYKIRAAFVLAGMEGMKYKSGVFQLEPGDKLFQYTDGVTEATDKDNNLYGMERLERALSKVCEREPQEILTAVKADIDEFVGEAPQFDDITMLCVEYKKRG